MRPGWRPSWRQIRRPGQWPLNRRGAMHAFLLALGFFSLYIGYLNYLINDRFDGDTWALPSQVYARALDLYPQLPLSSDDLVRELELSSYLAVSSKPDSGQYQVSQNTLELHTREFKFSDQIQAPRALTVGFNKSGIEFIKDATTGRPIKLFRMPPLKLGSYYPDSDEDRLLLAESEVPAILMDTLIAVEDRKFRDHWGLDFSAIMRAMAANLKAWRAVQGASTLTQQLAKNLFLTPEKTLLRKVNEAFMSLILEVRFSKQTIITAYINEVFLLQQNNIAIHGFARTSRMLFRRDVSHLEPQHVALLVGMVQGPSRYNPYLHPEAATRRRNRVLDVMLSHDLLNPDQHQQARASALGITDRLPGVNPFPAYLDLVKRQLRKSYTNQELTQRGLRIFTTFDPLVQHKMERGLARGLKRFQQPELQAAAVITNYLNGDILAMASDRVSDYPGFNRALMAQRPIGSLIKPMLLYSLLDSDLTLGSKLIDEPIEIQQSNGNIWAPRNYDRKLHGKVSLFQAFVRSYNLPFVKLGVTGGLEKLVQNLSQMNLLKHEVIYPSMLLGTSAMSAFEVSQMFQVIANNGYYTPLTTIRGVTDRRHRTLERVPVESHKLFDQARMIQVQRAMVGVAEQGTARYLKNRFPEKTLAGKTGTTNEARDSWFVGFSQQKMAVVWLGRDDNSPINLTGSSGALRVWADIMAELGFESFKVSRDDGVSWHYMNPKTGGITPDVCTNSVLLPFPKDRVPSRLSFCP